MGAMLSYTLVKNSEINSLAILLQNPHCLKQLNTRSVKLDMTPLMMAMNNRCLEIIKHLLAKGADPNYRNMIGVTCLLMAVGKNPRDHCKEPPPCRDTSEEILIYLTLLCHCSRMVLMLTIHVF